MKSAFILFGLLLSTGACENPSPSGATKDSVAQAGDSSRNALDSPAAENGKKDKRFSKTVALGKIIFHVFSPNNSLHNSIIIQPSGIMDNTMIQTGVLGDVVDAFAADINGDGYPEIYYEALTEAKELNLFGFGSEQNKRLTPIYMPDIGEDKKFGKGHRIKDEYTIIGTRLNRSFPIYKDQDPISSPTGGKRIVTYRLIPGKNGWILKPVDAKDMH